MVVRRWQVQRIDVAGVEQAVDKTAAKPDAALARQTGTLSPDLHHESYGTVFLG